ncbi:WxcM-like domain-containing protein [Klugiella xanthotipulae]|uniref:Acetyltransferase-like isoleucine patch superfamily enzyme n=1 Tax=Klugiella xanthotipulae TaxID=244735 RepID=A0A543HGY6_9MICO|nr:WxcM-like domain-containing protein [Klugiella xanthotipulae]TQM57591.1 acetyltransferase-like isoleucine patch superfamily enzyme [Klugiella xanthotipulae]
MTAFFHPNALVESPHIGDRTRVWAFAHILPGARIGSDCNICDGVFVENDVHVGDRVTVKIGVQLWDGITLEDDVFVGPNVTFTNDLHPRSRQYPTQFLTTVVRKGASIGGNATILPGITIGAGAMIGAGSVVTRDVPPGAVVVGNPAHIRGYVNTPSVVSDGGPVEPIDSAPDTTPPSRVKGVKFVRLTRAIDLRGSLVAGDVGGDVPFQPQRFFAVHDVPSAEVRGAHAHRECQQFLVCLSGSVHAIVDDGTNREEYVLDSPDRALYMPRMTWGTQYRYSPDAILLVLASLPYDNSDYIRDYDTFLAEVTG